MSKPGEVVSVHDVDVSDWPPEKQEIHDWCLKHVQSGHRYHAHTNRKRQIEVMVCEDCGVRFELWHSGGRGVIDAHIEEYLEEGKQSGPIWRARLHRMWSRFAPTASTASHVLLGFMAVWFGLDAYFIGEYELASAWFFALVWAFSGLVEREVFRGD